MWIYFVFLDLDQCVWILNKLTLLKFFNFNQLTMHKLTLTLLLASSFCFSQSLTISQDSSININPNSSVSVDGLELAPSKAYTIFSPNSITRSAATVGVGSNSSISRVYELSNGLSDYLGTLTFSYLDEELNSISEADLALEVLGSNSVWTSVSPDRDSDNNTLSYDFTDPVGFSKVTASSKNATLTIETETLNDFVRVYPNPTTDTVVIVSKNPQKATLFNTAGRKILETNNATKLDVIGLPSGVYLLNLQNNQNQISTFRIIKN